jgi:hypothetical protein
VAARISDLILTPKLILLACFGCRVPSDQDYEDEDEPMNASQSLSSGFSSDHDEEADEDSDEEEDAKDYCKGTTLPYRPPQFLACATNPDSSFFSLVLVG